MMHAAVLSMLIPRVSKASDAPIKVPVPEPVPENYMPKAPGCHLIQHSGPVHCARGRMRCRSCQVYSESKRHVLYAVDEDYDGISARPVLDFLDDDNKKFSSPYKTIGAFKDESQAKSFAQKYKIRIE
mmetsp:Transcript_6557/g.12319  ORF Transcript_6557/g.12319 Transcript_6557/m.12319 type:complete len:128 (-) Transcript_6557:94-477(-)